MVPHYDAAGNLTYDGLHRYTYDDEGRAIAVDSGGTGTYVYDADGLRVHRVGSEGTEDYVYDLSGHAAETYSETLGTIQRVEVYAGAMHVATYDNSTTYFDHTDWIGTERVRSAVNGTSFETCTSLPYGDNLLCQGSDPSPLHFTGKQRDTESGNDYFNARYLGSSMGRFMTPDPTDGHAEDPQTLNKYSYVLDNPLTLTDPTGLNPAPDQTCAVSTAVCYASGSNVSDTGDTFSAATPLFGTTNFAAWYATLPQQNTVTVEYVKGQDGNPAGHATINVDGQQAVGLEQKKDSVVAAVEDKTTPGVVRTVDPNREVKDQSVVQVSPGQAAKIQAFLNTAKHNPPNYNLYHSNCAQFCESALKAGGVKNVPNDITPRGLVRDLNGSLNIIDYIRIVPIPLFY